VVGGCRQYSRLGLGQDQAIVEQRGQLGRIQSKRRRIHPFTRTQAAQELALGCIHRDRLIQVGRQGMPLQGAHQSISTREQVLEVEACVLHRLKHYDTAATDAHLFFLFMDVTTPCERGKLDIG
jgi:hypothetical protein